ncbi:hypothetical protein L2E82_29594 [Cichorium intybus]|uniref:Uncharacterized protein n=1 Tax=Cichorium intybus TaxID=13427 RepID=A0ACB9CY70_CICIN|nr:hypothetical protein L2E82_29594 [Cichorium intybus]
MIKSIRILFAIAVYYDYEIWQMDVNTAFLNGHLLEDVYMDQPEGFVDPKHPNKVCKLKRSIYGLKQASRTWNICFDEKITNFGFIKNEDDSCVYKKASGSIVIFLVLYLDDILLFGNDIPTLKGVKAFLENCFSMKDLGEAAYVLGIKIYRDRSKRLIGLSQSAYIDKILKRFKMQDSKRGFLPIPHGTILSKSQCPSIRTELERMKHVTYASAIGSIMYAMLCTRPDVSCALSMTIRKRCYKRGKSIGLGSNHRLETRKLKREYEAEINAVVDYNQLWELTKPCGKIIVRSELGTSGQVLKRTRVCVEDSSRAPTIESTGSTFESGVGRHLQLLVNKFYIRSVSDDCSTIMMKVEDVCERISRNWDPVTGWHNLEEDIRELKQYIDVKKLEFYPFPYKRCTCIRDGHIITTRESADDIVVWRKGIHVGSEYYERIWDHLLGGATSIVVGTTYAMGLLVLVVETTYFVGPLYSGGVNSARDAKAWQKLLEKCAMRSVLVRKRCYKRGKSIGSGSNHRLETRKLKREYEAEINTVVDYNQVVQVEMTARHDEYTLMLLNWGFMRYTDASFQTDRDDSRSQSGYVFILNGGAVSWKSSKQEVIAQSTTESKYVAASEAAQEAVWMRKFIEDLGVVPSIRDPIEIFCDNLGAIAQAKEPRSHQKTKHIHRRYNYIRHEVKNGEISIRKVHTDQNLADPFTKPLPQAKNESHAKGI